MIGVLREWLLDRQVEAVPAPKEPKPVARMRNRMLRLLERAVSEELIGKERADQLSAELASATTIEQLRDWQQQISQETRFSEQKLAAIDYLRDLQRDGAMTGVEVEERTKLVRQARDAEGVAAAIRLQTKVMPEAEVATNIEPLALPPARVRSELDEALSQMAKPKVKVADMAQPIELKLDR